MQQRRHSLTWKSRERIRGITVGAITFGLLAVAIASICTWLSPTAGRSISDAIIDLCAVEMKPWLGSFPPLHPIWASLLAGLWRGAHIGWLTWKLQGRFFASYNDEVLTRIRLLAFDPLWGSPELDDTVPLKWLPPGELSPRGEVWTTLQSFAHRHASDGRSTWLTGKPRVANTDQFAFRWRVLTGRAGSGKSRMGVELCRKLARHDLLEGDPSWLWTHFTAWHRIVWPHLKRRDNDPWDAGWLRPDISTRSCEAHAGRRAIGKSFLDSLSSWEPRRPTILLLDDPLRDDAKQIVSALWASRARFHFPVRLLIVAQAVPEDLWTVRSASDREWLDGFDGDAIRLGSESHFTEQEIDQMAADLSLAPFATASEKLHFVQETRGNPLLVELGLRWLASGRRLQELSRQNLLMARAARIAETLESAGFRHTHHQFALAAATIAGPPDSSFELQVEATLSQRFASIKPIADTFPEAKFDPERLEQLFKLLDPPAPGELPPVRPEMIGDAFVRYVLLQNTSSEKENVIPAAWHANPVGAMDALRRILQNAKDDDVLAVQLRRQPPSDVGIELLELAFAYAETAILILREDWDYVDLNDASDNLQVALTCISALSSPVAANSLSRFAAIMDVDSRELVVRSPAAYSCVCAAVSRALLLDDDGWTDVDIAAAIRATINILKLMSRWGYSVTRVTGAWPASIFGDFLSELMQRDAQSAGPEITEELEEILWEGSGWFAPSCFSALADLYKYHASLDGQGELYSVRERRLRTASLYTQDGQRKIWPEVEEINSIVDSRFRDVPEFEIERAKVWQMLMRTHEFEARPRCVEILKTIDEIATQKDCTSALFQLERARTWRAFLLFFSHPPLAPPFDVDISLCREAVLHVDCITSEPHICAERDFVLEKARAWAHMAGVYAFAPAHNKTQEPRESAIQMDEIESIAHMMDEIIDKGHYNRDFMMLRVRASLWYQVVNGIMLRGDLVRSSPLETQLVWAARCEAGARRLDTVGEEFAGEMEIEQNRAFAWSVVCNYFPTHPTAATRRDEICARLTFSGISDMRALPPPPPTFISAD